MLLPTDFPDALAEWPALRVLAEAHGAKAAENLFEFLRGLQESDPARFEVERNAFDAVWGGAEESLDAVALRETAYEMSQSLAEILSTWDEELFVSSAAVMPDAAVTIWTRFAGQLENIAQVVRLNLPSPAGLGDVVNFTSASSAQLPSGQLRAGRSVDNRGIVI